MQYLPESVQLAVAALDEAYKEFQEYNIASALVDNDENLRHANAAAAQVRLYTFRLIAALTEEVL